VVEREQRAESREQRAESREQRAESREQTADSREQTADSREYPCLLFLYACGCLYTPHHRHVFIQEYLRVGGGGN
jgi:hypothetical protein